MYLKSVIKIVEIIVIQKCYDLILNSKLFSFYQRNSNVISRIFVNSTFNICFNAQNCIYVNIKLQCYQIKIEIRLY